VGIEGSIQSVDLQDYFEDIIKSSEITIFGHSQQGSYFINKLNYYYYYHQYYCCHHNHNFIIITIITTTQLDFSHDVRNCGLCSTRVKMFIK
jgi:hypothetical protein